LKRNIVSVPKIYGVLEEFFLARADRHPALFYALEGLAPQHGDRYDGSSFSTNKKTTGR